MSTVELSEEALEAAQREAARRGVEVSSVITEAVQRFVIGTDLGALLNEFRQADAANPAVLNEEDAMRVADEELAAFRRQRG